MSADKSNIYPTLALETKVEEDFVAPLTAVRGSLEILRDFAELSDEERQRFLDAALRGCTRLEQSVKELGEAVYSAGQKAEAGHARDFTSDEHKRYAERINVMRALDIVEIDFSDFEFSSSQIVNHFHDVIEEVIEATGRKWFLLVNYRDCSIWPEAWVAFAHRGKRVNVNFSLGTVRYAELPPGEDDADASAGQDSSDTGILPSREMALARLDDMRRTGPA